MKTFEDRKQPLKEMEIKQVWVSVDDSPIRMIAIVKEKRK